MNVPQGLKPPVYVHLNGTAKAVPYPRSLCERARALPKKSARKGLGGMRPDPETEKEILAALKEFDRVSRERDLSGMLRLFAQEGVIFVGTESGGMARGREELQSFFEDHFSEPIAYGLRWEKVSVEVFGDVAWAFSDCHIETMSAAGQHEHPYRVTGIFQRVGGKWLWVHYHGSEPAG